MEVWNWGSVTGLVIFLKVKELPTDDQTQYQFSEFPFTMKPTSRRSTLLRSLDFSFSIIVSKGFPGGSAVKYLPAVQETWVLSLGWEDPLEKEMATHPNILAWEIPWREKPGELQSMGSQRVRHDWAHTHYYLLTGNCIPAEYNKKPNSVACPLTVLKWLLNLLLQPHVTLWEKGKRRVTSWFCPLLKGFTINSIWLLSPSQEAEKRG